jgi:hypothetical protein
MSQVLEWCPDVNKHLSPLREMNALEVRTLFSGLPAWQLAYWACMAGAIPRAAQDKALGLEVKKFDIFWDALDVHLMGASKPSQLQEGGGRYVPELGIAAVVAAVAPEEEEGDPIAGKPRGRMLARPAVSEPAAATATGAAGSLPRASHAGSPGICIISTPPDCHHHCTCSSNASRQYLASMSYLSTWARPRKGIARSVPRSAAPAAGAARAARPGAARLKRPAPRRPAKAAAAGGPGAAAARPGAAAVWPGAARPGAVRPGATRLKRPAPRGPATAAEPAGPGSQKRQKR